MFLIEPGRFGVIGKGFRIGPWRWLGSRNWLPGTVSSLARSAAQDPLMQVLEFGSRLGAQLFNQRPGELADRQGALPPGGQIHAGRGN